MWSRVECGGHARGERDRCTRKRALPPLRPAPTPLRRARLLLHTCGAATYRCDGQREIHALARVSRSEGAVRGRVCEEADRGGSSHDKSCMLAPRVRDFHYFMKSTTVYSVYQSRLPHALVDRLPGRPSTRPSTVYHVYLVDGRPYTPLPGRRF